MPENDYYGSVYGGQSETPLSQQSWAPKLMNYAGLTADDNGGAVGVDLSNVYRSLNQGANDDIARRKMLDKQLRQSYMGYDSSKIPAQYRPGYQKAFDEFKNYYLQNAKALKKGDVNAAAELEKRQNAVRDYVAQSQTKGSELKAATQRIMAMADKKDAGWVQDQLNKLHGYADPDVDFDDVYSGFNGNNKVDVYKFQNNLFKGYAKPIQEAIGRAANGAPIYRNKPNIDGNKQVALRSAETPEGKRIIEQLVEDGKFPNYTSARSAYIDDTTKELVQRSLGGVNQMNKYDDHSFNTGIKGGMYNMAKEMFPINKALKLSQIERNQKSMEFGNSAQVNQEYWDSISDMTENDPQAAAKEINAILPAKSFLNGGSPVKYENGRLKGAYFVGDKIKQIDVPATVEGGQDLVRELQANVISNAQATTRQRLKTKKKTEPKPSTKPAAKKKTIAGF